MKITYDKVADAVYFTINDGKVAKTVEANSKTIVDYDKKGNLIGFEILNYSENKGSVQELEKKLKQGIPVHIKESTPVVI